MKDENKELVLGIATGAGITVCIGACVLMGRNLRLNNPSIDTEINTIEGGRDLPGRQGTSSSSTHIGTPTKPEATTVGTPETTQTVTSSTSTETTQTVTSSISTETSAYALTDEELLAMFPSIVQDNSGNVISSTTTVVSETPGQQVSATSSISGGEVLSVDYVTVEEELEVHYYK